MTDRSKPKRAARSKGKPANDATQALNPMEERFCHEYLSVTPNNITEAYRRAGYTCSGSAARAAASRLFKRPSIQAAIKAMRAADARKYEITRERVLNEYAKLAFTDPRNFFREDGSLKHPTELDDMTAGALTQFEVEEEYIGDEPDQELEAQPNGGALKRQHAKTLAIGRTAKIKWSEKRAALDAITRIMGYDKEQNPAGTAENPFHMIVRDLQGRSSALTPTASADEDDEP